MTCTQKARERYRITFYEDTPSNNKKRLQEEFDAFWTYGVEITDMEPRKKHDYTGGQYYYVTASEGFNEAFREENEVDIRVTIKFLGEVNAVE